MTCWTVCADERLTVAELPLRSVRSRLPSGPRPAPPLRLLSKTVCRPPRMLRPVIAPPVSVAAPPVPVTVPPDTVLARPRSYSAVEPFSRGQGKGPAVRRRGLVGDDEPVVGRIDRGGKLAGRGGVDLIDDLAQGGWRGPRGAAGGDGRQLDRAVVAVGQRVPDVGEHVAGEHAGPVVQHVEVQVGRKAEDLVAVGRRRGDVDAGQAEGGRGGPAVHLLDPEVRRIAPVSPVLSIKSMRSPSATAVTLTVPLLLMSLSTSPMVCAVDRSMVAVAPLRSVILIFPGTKPLPPLSESRLTLCVEVRPEAEA